MERKQLGNLVLLALFVALIVLLGSTPLGLIPLGFINVTILCVPVVVGALYMGWKYGLILGLAFGLTSLEGVTFCSSKVMRSRTRRSVRSNPARHWFCRSSPTVRTRRAPRWSISST